MFSGSSKTRPLLFFLVSMVVYSSAEKLGFRLWRSGSRALRMFGVQGLGYLM